MISIIIPAFNAASTIVAALDSVLAQTFTDHEAIVVDDCSTDNTVEVVRHWIKEHEEEHIEQKSLLSSTSRVSRLTLHTLPSNVGPAAARNRGIQEAKGEWIAFLDSDDIWMPHKLEVQMRFAAAHPEVALWCGECIGVMEGGGKRLMVNRLSLLRNSINNQEPITNNLPGSGPNNQFPITSNHFQAITLENLAIGNPIGCSTVLVKKAAIDAAGGFDEQFRGPEDYDLWMRIVADWPAVKSNVLMARYSENRGCLSMDDRTFLPQVMRVLAKAYSRGGVLDEYRNFRSLAVANQYRSACWMASQRGAYVVAMKYLAYAWCVSLLSRASIRIRGLHH